MKTHLFVLALLSLFVMSVAPPKWERLGSRKVNFGLDVDTIPVGAHEGAFTKVKIEVRGGSLNMHRMVIHFKNGENHEVQLKHNFSKGSGSRIIDLPGNKRIIKSITFHYDTKNMARSRATVHVFGRH